MPHEKSQRDPALGKAIGKLPSGVYILAAQTGGGVDLAMLASWVQQAGFEPPMLTVALTPDRPAHQAIRETGFFTISILPQGDTALMKKYARGIPTGEDPFAGVETALSPAGRKYLAGALAWLDCRLGRVLQTGGDHDLLVAEILTGGVLREGAPFTHVRGSGWHY